MATKYSDAKVLKVLRDVFKLRHLRDGQRDVIKSILEGRDTLAVLPTGAGKSLCYQLPALLTPGTAIVVSPLISLAKDQKDKLDNLNVTSVILNSSVSEADQRESLISVRKGKTEFIYVTPERLQAPDFYESLGETKIDLLVIDEAHCITQWGHDFRPAYLGLSEAREKLGNPPVLALTATATPEVIHDIAEQLKLEKMNVIFTSVFRQNLQYSAFVTECETEKKLRLIDAVKRYEGNGSVIIYSSTVRGVEDTSEFLASEGIENTTYHGKLPRKEKLTNQDEFISGRTKVMVATTAFGMGIDKPDIRAVIHFNFPGTLETYYQESGRAGRDGERADCLLFYLKKDKSLQSLFKSGKYPNEKQIRAFATTLGQAEKSLSVGEIAEKSEVPKTKVIVLLQALRDRDLVTAENFFVRPFTIDDETTIVKEFTALKEADSEKLRQMVIYSQTSLCRWHMIVKYFGEEPSWQDCGHCDNCRAGKSAPLASADQTTHEEHSRSFNRGEPAEAIL